ncbi:GFA family protein [Aliihoeflea aestuarii]|jgi:hypothetical protein|uniref:GFA family protein n=1 Tax=Aliihoeflea aestuarii TaxID=453840 RepID=UPI0027E2F22D|nr:GFA family protein [Aliihoeflea aestuarii]
MMRKGSCLCGAVRFEAEGSVRPVVFCHCTQCRKQSGHFYATTSVADAHLSVDGRENVTWFAASATARRGFCNRCGSALFWKGNGRDVTSILAGAFDEPAELVAACHIFTADKGGYYEIEDHLRQYPHEWDGATD